MARVGVVLSGCGFLDGSEIHEAVLTLLAIAKMGHEAVCYAPDVDQTDVINHLTNEPMQEKRNVLVESARIARGEIKALSQATAETLDALIFPGGFGAAKNLSSFAADGTNCRVNKEAAMLAKTVHAAGKPIGVICIAPATLAKILEGNSVQLTIGNDQMVAQAIEALGHRHHACAVREIQVDEAKKIVSTPAYMLAKSIVEAQAGIEKLVQAVIRLAQ